MPGFPKLLKAWQEPISVGLVAKSTSSAQNGAAVVALKNALKSPPLFPWIVKGSSNSVSFDTAGADLWVDETNIVSSTSGAHSWVWLRSVSGVELVIDCNQTSNTQMNFVWSMSAGFTGGSLTARPTATDEQNRLPSAWAMGANVGHFRLNLIHSADGRVTYAWILYRGIIVHSLLIGDATPTHASWSPAIILYAQGSNGLGNSGLNDQTFLTNFDSVDARAAGGRMLFRWTSPVTQNQQLEISQVPESRTGKWQIWSIGLVCLNSPRRGKHGVMIDLFKVPQSTPAGWLFRSLDGGTVLMSFGGGWCAPWSPNMLPRVF